MAPWETWQGKESSSWRSRLTQSTSDLVRGADQGSPPEVAGGGGRGGLSAVSLGCEAVSSWGRMSEEAGTGTWTDGGLD